MAALRRIFSSVWKYISFAVLTLGSVAAIAQSSASPPTAGANAQAAEWMHQAMQLAADGQLAQAEIVLEKARAASPGNTEILTELAKVKDREGDLPGAIVIFRQVADALPRSSEAHINLAMALADSKDLNGALKETSTAAELSPKLASAHLNRARILADLHRLDDARAEFTLASHLAPTNPDCFYYWALLERENGNYAKESSLLRTVEQLQPKNEKALNLLGESLVAESKEAEAIAVWRHVLAIDADSSEAAYSLSLALRSTDPAESKRLMERFHSLQEREKRISQVNTLGNEAYHAINNRQWTEAITDLRQAIDLCGDCQYQAALHKDLGLALCQNGDMHAGEAELRIAFRLNPADRDTLKALSAISHP